MMFILLGALGFTVLMSIVIYNRLVGRKNQAANALHGIDAMLKKRFDLLPNLVATVQEFAKHEKGLLVEVTAMRSRVAQAGNNPVAKMEMAADMSGLMGRLMAVAESYPEVKAADNFMQLQRTIHETEEQLSAARRSYNAAITDYNDAVGMFPSNIFAALFGFKELPLFTASTEERKNPDVRTLFKAG